MEQRMYRVTIIAETGTCELQEREHGTYYSQHTFQHALHYCFSFTPTPGSFRMYNRKPDFKD